jgi:hypothetical protein
MIDYIVSQLVGLGVGGLLTYFVPKVVAKVKAWVVKQATDPDSE